MDTKSKAWMVHLQLPVVVHGTAQTDEMYNLHSNCVTVTTTSNNGRSQPAPVALVCPHAAGRGLTYGAMYLLNTQ